MANSGSQENTEEPRMFLKSSKSKFKYTLKWEIEELSKMYLNHHDSPVFLVEPGSVWTATLIKDAERIRINFEWYSKDTQSTLNYELKISDGMPKILYATSGSVAHSSETLYFAVFPPPPPAADSPAAVAAAAAAAAAECMGKVMKPAKDKLLIEMNLTVTNQVTENVPPASLLQSNNILEDALKIKFQQSDEADEKGVKTRSIFFINLLSRMTMYNATLLDERNLLILQKVLTCTNEELLKDVDVESVFDLYEVSSKYSLTDLKNDCKSALLLKVTPDNAQKLFEILREWYRK